MLKAGNKYDFYSHAEPIVRGDWQSRISAYSRLFGACPFAAEVSRLERLRGLRNDAGHSFGRDIKFMRFSESSLVQPLPRISDEDIQRFLELANTVAAATEGHLGPAYVGSYEVVRLYHSWRTSLAPPNAGHRTRARLFSQYFNSVTDSPYGRDRFGQLVQYYDAV